MAVYLFTFHSYRSWSVDRTRGYVKRDAKGIQKSNEALARYHDRIARDEPVTFEEKHQQILLWIIHDACCRRGWQPRFIATESTHVHVLVSWKRFQPWQRVRDRLKNLISWALSKKLSRQGKRWLSGGASRKRILHLKHYNHLIRTYLPGHSGLQWKEGDEPPKEPEAVRDTKNDSTRESEDSSKRDLKKESTRDST